MNESPRRVELEGETRLSTVELSRPLAEASGWMHALGILSVAIGILLIPLVIWVIARGGWEQSPNFVIAIVSIWQGVILFSSGTAARVAYQHDNDFALVAALARLSTWFKVMGWMIVLQIIFSIGILLLKKYGM